jgi:hypothetical protein
MDDFFFLSLSKEGVGETSWAYLLMEYPSYMSR